MSDTTRDPRTEREDWSDKYPDRPHPSDLAERLIAPNKPLLTRLEELLNIFLADARHQRTCRIRSVGSMLASPEDRPAMCNCGLRELHNAAPALIAIARAAQEFRCPECGGKGKVLDEMAWRDRPENYRDCTHCEALRSALAALEE